MNFSDDAEVVQFVDLTAGSLFFFNWREKQQLGLKIMDSNSQAGFVCFTEAVSGDRLPTLYSDSQISNQTALFLPQATIVPMIAPGTVGYTRALDLPPGAYCFSENRRLLCVARQKSVMFVNIDSGTLVPLNDDVTWVNEWKMVDKPPAMTPFPQTILSWKMKARSVSAAA